MLGIGAAAMVEAEVRLQGVWRTSLLRIWMA